MQIKLNTDIYILHVSVYNAYLYQVIHLQIIPKYALYNYFKSS